MKRLYSILAVIAAAASLSAAESTRIIQNPSSRTATSLDGAWHTVVDPYDVGYYDYRYQPLANGGFAANQQPASKSDLVEYDFDRSPTLQVPGDWNTQRPELFLYEGSVWYKRDFDYALPAGKRLFVYFGAANYHAIAWLNGAKLGEHEGGFTPFQFEITKLVKPKGNFLIVRVDDKRRRDGVPTVNTDWWNYGGLTRSVSLIETPGTFVSDYWLRLAKGSTSKVEATVWLDGEAAAGGKVTVRIPEAGVAVDAVAGADGVARAAFDANLTLWSAEAPKLYDVAVSGAGDEVRDRIGFRTVATRDYDLLVDGKSVFLRGISIHGEAPLRASRGVTAADARTLLGWVKELDGNFARLAHYPHTEYMPRTADEMGIMLWEEIPVYWTIEWENRDTLANAQRQLAEMIERDKNRASVILWSVSNETPVTEPRLRFLKTLVAEAKRLDDTRLVTAALERHYEGDTTQVIDDPLGEVLDVVGCNEYMGWYDGPPEKMDTVHWEMKYKKPLVFSEFGGGALFGYRGDAGTRWTEDYQRSIYEHQVKMLDRIPFLRGTTPWILVDFRSPRRPLAGIQDFFNRKGLISDRGEKKQAFFTLREWYRKKAQASQ